MTEPDFPIDLGGAESPIEDARVDRIDPSSAAHRPNEDLTDFTRESGRSKIYEATPIPLGSRHIRLFEFERLRDGSISGTLHVHSLDDHSVQWIALSYTWNCLDHDVDYARLYEIDINGRPFLLKANVWRALNCLLDKKQEALGGMGSQAVTADGLLEPVDMHYQYDLKDWRYFWIDSICIDQGSVAERSDQVAQMHAIFAGSQLVIGWLTPDPTLSGLAPVQIKNALLYRYTCPIVNEHHQDVCNCWKERCSMVNARAHRKAVLENLFWQRMWIVQEMLLPRKVILLYQGVWISFEWLEHATGRARYPCREVLLGRSSLDHDRLQEQAEYRIKLRSSDVSGQTIFRSERDLTTSIPQASIINLIRMYRSQGCSDPRDRVYGLLGLPSSAHSIRPDYSKTRIELLLEVAAVDSEYSFSWVANRPRQQHRTAEDPAYCLPCITRAQRGSVDDGSHFPWQISLDTGHFNDVRYLVNALAIDPDDLIAQGLIAFYENAYRPLGLYGLETSRPYMKTARYTRMVKGARYDGSMIERTFWTIPQTPVDIVNWLAIDRKGRKELRRIFDSPTGGIGEEEEIDRRTFQTICSDALYSIKAIDEALKHASIAATVRDRSLSEQLSATRAFPRSIVSDSMGALGDLSAIPATKDQYDSGVRVYRLLNLTEYRDFLEEKDRSFAIVLDSLGADGLVNFCEDYLPAEDPRGTIMYGVKKVSSSGRESIMETALRSRFKLAAWIPQTRNDCRLWVEVAAERWKQLDDMAFANLPRGLTQMATIVEGFSAFHLVLHHLIDIIHQVLEH